MEKSDTALELRKTVLIGLFVYYFVLLVASLTGSIIVLEYPASLFKIVDIQSQAFVGSICIAIVGSSTYYIRKLYKGCIGGALKMADDRTWNLPQIGTLIYYIARPLFAISFSLIVVMGLQSAVAITSNGQIEPKPSFIYVTMITSFFTGFRCGNFIKNLEEHGNRVTDRFINKTLRP